MYLSGVPKKEMWIIWAIIAWILMALGPGLLLGSKPTFIGIFPTLYVYTLVCWGAVIVLNLILSTMIGFVNVPESFDEEEGGQK